MKFALLVIFISSIFLSCKSIPPDENQNLAGDRNSCEDKTGWDRQKCLNDKSIRWERIENSNPTREDLKRDERLTWTHVRKHYKVCRADLCHEEILIEEDWSLGYLIAREGGVALLTLAIFKFIPMLF